MNKTLFLNQGEYKKWKPKTPAISKKFNPAMTSNNTPPPYVAAQSSTSGNNAWCAFDGIGDYNTASWISQVKPFTEEWISIYLGENKKFTAYDLYSDTKNQMPKSWYIEGSDNNIDWEIIDTQTNIELKQTVANNFTISNSSKGFLYYRMRITAINDTVNSLNRVRINLLEFYEIESEATSSHWATISTTTPTQQQFASDGMDDISSLLNRKVTTLEPVPMTLRNDILQQGDVGKVFSKSVNLNKYMDIRTMKVEVK